MAIIISNKIKEKLSQRHHVTCEHVEQCFGNRDGRFLFDTREEHASDPATMWFISETNLGRKLKVVFIPRDGDVYLRSAFEPNADELKIYNSKGY